MLIRDAPPGNRKELTWAGWPGSASLEVGAGRAAESEVTGFGGEVGRSWTLGHFCMGREGTEEAFPTGEGGMCVQGFWGWAADLVSEGNWPWVLRRLEME